MGCFRPKRHSHCCNGSSKTSARKVETTCTSACFSGVGGMAQSAHMTSGFSAFAASSFQFCCGCAGGSCKPAALGTLSSRSAPLPADTPSCSLASSSPCTSPEGRTVTALLSWPSGTTGASSGHLSVEPASLTDASFSMHSRLQALAGSLAPLSPPVVEGTPLAAVAWCFGARGGTSSLDGVHGSEDPVSLGDVRLTAGTAS